MRRRSKTRKKNRCIQGQAVTNEVQKGAMLKKNLPLHCEKKDYPYIMERIYLDTSVFGGYFEPEFKQWSKFLIDKIIKGEIKLLYSQLTEIELNGSPQYVKDLVKQIPDKHIEFLAITDEANELADRYLQENVVGNTSRADCVHIAIATLNDADILASWNFKHIVNVRKIRSYNAVNYKLGHRILEIRTPREILNYEN